MTVNVYHVGDRVDIQTSTPFQDADGTAFDPDVVTFWVTVPGSDPEDYIYLTDDEVTRIDTGDYMCSIDVDVAGDYQYAILAETSTGENRGADQGVFTVMASNIQ